MLTTKKFAVERRELPPCKYRYHKRTYHLPGNGYEVDIICKKMPDFAYCGNLLRKDECPAGLVLYTGSGPHTDSSGGRGD